MERNDDIAMQGDSFLMSKKVGMGSRINFSFSCFPAFLITSVLIPYISGDVLLIDSDQGRARHT
jgi:hypothetical protein